MSSVQSECLFIIDGDYLKMGSQKLRNKTSRALVMNEENVKKIETFVARQTGCQVKGQTHVFDAKQKSSDGSPRSNVESEIAKVMKIMKTNDQQKIKTLILLTGNDSGAETFFEVVEYFTDVLSNKVWICAFEESQSVKLCN